MQEKQVVPVVFAANDEYAPYLGVAIYSLIMHASKENEYKIYILVTHMSNKHQNQLLDMSGHNICIEIINVKNLMSKRTIPNIVMQHITIETVYRLLMDVIFPQYDKMLYLDCDIIINKDVALLFQENLDGAVLAAVRGRIFRNSERYIRENLNLPVSDYVNAGVLLVNMQLFHKLQIGERAICMLEEKEYWLRDQDVLNLLCNGHIKYLDGRWNVEWQHLAEKDKKPVIDPSREGTLEYIYDPYIVHYTGYIKPWSYPEIELAEYFWNYANKTVFYPEIIKKKRTTIYKYSSQHFFPKNRISKSEKVIIYGAGTIGKAFVIQNIDKEYCNIVGWVDTKAVMMGDMVENIEIVKTREYDKILISIEDKHVIDEVRGNLFQMGVEPEKIISI